MPRPSSYQDHAQEFMQHRDRSQIGVTTVVEWSKSLAPKSGILDLGCGSGKPIGTALTQRGFMLYGVDASETLISAYRENLPQANVACEAVEDSSFFDRQFDGAIAIGLVFLMPAQTQTQFIRRVATALTNDGRFLFTAPVQVHHWKDVLTGTKALSLGRDSYLKIAHKSGLELEKEWIDEGENHYFGFRRRQD